MIEPHPGKIVRIERPNPTGLLARLRLLLTDGNAEIRSTDVSALVATRIVVQAYKPLDRYVQANLLANLADAGLRSGFAALDHSSGKNPVPLIWRVGAFEQDDLVLDEHHAIRRECSQALWIHGRTQAGTPFEGGALRWNGQRPHSPHRLGWCISNYHVMLFAFDFDGTLADAEMTVLLGEEAGVADEIAGIADRAMNDEVAYATSLRERAGLLEGLPESRIDAAYDRITLRQGSAELIAALRGAGHDVVILTGGFEEAVVAVLENEGIEVDDLVSNQLPTENGALTGDIEGELVDGTKDEALHRLAAERGLDLADTVAMGDGANDIPMLQVAGEGIGIAPKPAVRPHCDMVFDSIERLHQEFEQRDVV
ncbi:MAG: phosphoserine phosphatase [Halobacteriales archaeon]